ncbi:6,7-dimethyl-8-ribityllumazine synthase [Rhodothalassium salexigens DSM 2132]|uniref:6,7-dimethyl-8-ribityllumazine synthase n=1 Tax=Rhodothalassium salexigens DSM 2132 TaxID=1188247 RepID=A0A4R2PQQ9_RHOSA|nr:6,7-dimethyl-8-ribityllumazine synthase [Rhodothalassium salexigens]MBB4209984.1 6,7-dimethyl-8-ribityllumazine synthase [Rhodothalassium salexigens DSM 2132]MBK1637644.1 6,7-dimethyl-8-ribityllumazine synthase [Rhodothalassium salexigens DSM 2132]MBK5920052.1 6,7-dimethyl-8-ribityllumazine synthase [Rhodothalassium salexigens]TCP38149.1 6,7-dimethyl-8-ribityllumazine synthase [Rhodothalassium salexigens DSM 2132]
MAPNSRVMIVEARFYDELADELVAGAEAVLAEANAEVRRVTVPGAFEIPGAIAMAETISSVHYDGYVALGCVIRGETTHYDYVCGESARALQDMAVRDRVAIGYGILTVENQEQAWARADRKRGNKGGDAARACLSMIDLAREFGRS